MNTIPVRRLLTISRQTNQSIFLVLSSGVLKSGMVDHYMIYAIRKVNAWRIRSKKPKILETRSLRNYDKMKFINDLKEVNWEVALSPFCCMLNHDTGEMIQ